MNLMQILNAINERTDLAKVKEINRIIDVLDKKLSTHNYKFGRDYSNDYTIQVDIDSNLTIILSSQFHSQVDAYYNPDDKIPTVLNCSIYPNADETKVLHIKYNKNPLKHEIQHYLDDTKFGISRDKVPNPSVVRSTPDNPRAWYKLYANSNAELNAHSVQFFAVANDMLNKKKYPNFKKFFNDFIYGKRQLSNDINYFFTALKGDNRKRFISRLYQYYIDRQGPEA